MLKGGGDILADGELWGLPMRCLSTDSDDGLGSDYRRVTERKTIYKCKRGGSSEDVARKVLLHTLRRQIDYAAYQRLSSVVQIESTMRLIITSLSFAAVMGISSATSTKLGRRDPLTVYSAMIAGAYHIFFL